MNIIPVVVWYNPEKLGPNTAIQNILTYSNHFNKVIIVDNSIADNTQLAIQIPNSKYFPNFDNLGIAKALNQGCETAIAAGYSWVMTMDQDSSWDDDNLNAYLAEAKGIFNTDNQIVSFSPLTIPFKRVRSVLGNVKYIIWGKRKEKNEYIQKPNFEYTDRVISSGNIINLDIWRSVGAFNNDLFINDVDYDFCYRCIQKGYKIAKVLNCKMNHVDGEPQKSFFPHAFWYHEERIYYAIRNKFYILTHYPEFAKKYNYKRTITKILFEKIFFLELGDLKFIFKGIKDGKNGRYGKYNA